MKNYTNMDYIKGVSSKVGIRFADLEKFEDGGIHSAFIKEALALKNNSPKEETNSTKIKLQKKSNEKPFLKELQQLEDGGIFDSIKSKYSNVKSQFSTEKLAELEQEVDDYLGNPGEEARILSIGEDQGEEVDSIRHANAGRLTAKAVEGKTGSIPFISKGLGLAGSTILGAAHEFISPNKASQLPFREALEDIYNNTYGAALNTFSSKNELKQIQAIQDASASNRLPDGITPMTEEAKNKMLLEPSENLYFQREGMGKKYNARNRVTKRVNEEFKDGGAKSRLQKRINEKNFLAELESSRNM